MAAQNARSHRRLLGVLLGVCCASAFTGQSLAQQTPPNNQPSDEIVVTARKVSENLQDVPVTESVVTGTQLQERGANDIKDVLLTIPGLNYSGEDRGRSNYTIRGVSTNATSPAVGIYLDDVSLVTLANTFAGAFDPVFFDMEQLEVLKGPQGTLYGGSAMGGAIC
jgi:outer membrane receptor for ferrienterochelin and colicin